MMKKDPEAIKTLSENWPAEEKFAVILNAATLSEVELNTDCRETACGPVKKY